MKYTIKETAIWILGTLAGFIIGSLKLSFPIFLVILFLTIYLTNKKDINKWIRGVSKSFKVK